MRRSGFVLLVLMCAAVTFVRAQAVESATSRELTITAGGLASGFQPGDGHSTLVGAGTYVDFHFSHWVQLEAEGRWLRWNEYQGEHEDTYLIGPRVPILQIGSGTTIFGKALIGYGKMTFPFQYGYGSFTALAFGGSVDHHLGRKLSVKADFEYQYWPKWLNNTSLSPYGASVGFGYRVF
jgi:hypothetical protein